MFQKEVDRDNIVEIYGLHYYLEAAILTSQKDLYMFQWETFM